jgi:hypothetical protein
MKTNHFSPITLSPFPSFLLGSGRYNNRYPLIIATQRISKAKRRARKAKRLARRRNRK